MISSAKSSPRSRDAVHVALGRADYERTLGIQRELHGRRAAGETVDVVITVEHNPVFTIGRSGALSSVLVSADVLKREHIQVYEVERGGGVTYHGPGQLVVYPIVDLRDHGCGLKGYVERLEEATIRTLRTFAIAGGRRAGHPGVWVRERKIASIGVYVKHWVTRHGLALNVRVDPSHFAMIHPCGLQVETVSMNDLVDTPISFERVTAELLDRLAEQFDWNLRPIGTRSAFGEASGATPGVD
jgi:lipoic acid synthetase